MQTLINLVNTIPSHKALNNAFYSKWIKQLLPIEHIAIFVRNYGEFTLRFPEVLSELIITSQNIQARVEYTKILYSELGYGKAGKVHSFLFDKFFSELSDKLGKPGFLSMENLTRNTPLLKMTKKFIDGEKNLYSQNSAIGAGAQLALECQAYNMISQLYEGARNYANLWANKSSFHEACEFFYIHIGTAEKEHRAEALCAVNNIVKNDPILIKEAIYGFNEHLNLFAEFWDAVSTEMETIVHEN